jgi:hypothetical protein
VRVGRRVDRCVVARERVHQRRGYAVRLRTVDRDGERFRTTPGPVDSGATSRWRWARFHCGKSGTQR